VDENVKWEGGLIALNSFGFGGVNTHAIFKPRLIEISNEDEKNDFPEIILASGNTMEGVRNMLKAAMNNSHLARLVNEAHKIPHPNHTHLGFALPHSNALTVEEIPKTGSQLWFVFNGMGSQWLGMGKSLMKIISVEKAIRKCSEILQKVDPKFDLLSLIMNGGSEDDPTEIFVGITAIQIALVDTLECLGVRADGFVGHSAGEIGCAYADHCLTLEEAILSSYWRGKSLDLVKSNVEEELGMGVVNLSWDKISTILPEGLYLACNNGKTSVTVSGAKRLLIPFLEQQKAIGRTASVVNSCGIAFHSPHMQHAAPYLLEKLKGVIKSPKARSDGWVTTCGGSSKADATYFVHNLTSPVSFYGALKSIPVESTILEIGPSGLLKGLIKKSVKESCVIPLQKRDSEDSFGDFLNAIGHLYIAKGSQSGVDPTKLNEKPLTFPVPISTPSLSSLVAWDHTLIWDVPKYGKVCKH
jgi:fatty acid synthase